MWRRTLIIQSAGDQPTHVQTNTGAMTDTATSVLVQRPPLKFFTASGHPQRKLVLHSSESFAGSRFARTHVFRSLASYTNTVCRIDAELRDDAKSLLEKIQNQGATSHHERLAAGPTHPRRRRQTPSGFLKHLISLAFLHFDPAFAGRFSVQRLG